MKSILLLSLLFTISVSAQILSERDRAVLKDEILADRFDNLLPQLMDASEIEMWVVISREYNEDPVMRTMLPAEWLNARRRTILVFYRNKTDNTIEKLAVARYDVGENITSAWDKEKQPDQWERLVEIITERNPNTIGINVSEHFAIADGLVKTDYDELMEALPAALENKVVSAEKLAIAWIETRTAKEMELYNTLVAVTHAIIDEAFSEKVITPGVTTTEDVVWWMRQKVTNMGLETWFHPTIDIQRDNEALKSHIESFSKSKPEDVILRGDLLHCDFGITYIGLNTDCQQHAYVLKEDETEVPQFLSEAFAKGNRVQDIFTANFETGKTGNQIFLKSLNEARAEGLVPSIYTHPLGVYGHSAGTTLGMWDSQDGVPFTGDYPLHINTVYAIELNTTVTIPQWKKDIRIMLEEAGFYGSNGFRYVNKRQTAIKPIKTK
ncbi:Xaa-Pro aminopeptidase [Ulvibacter sp. MAR_2010_11]|uniref:M24 family metallopeptidase n=1 Tax=Ulvibacter sp. MAR_2010_11 TaxID=1250229 RepID=UPI000C2C74FB|nr:M24 family metallopeptidase [Ulvibacter sp. MAR_2010_11]PKA84548.1 Xaa-Pro aminopeptidase [Ulvibacter sp. MAR_2010_11]